MRTLPLLLLVALLLTACSSSAKPAASSGTPGPKETAGAAVLRQMGFRGKGQWGRVWDELHPAQQAVVDRDKFASCSANATPISIDSAVVKETYADPVRSASFPETPATAVTVALKIHSGAVSDARNLTVHEVNVGGAWHWILGDTDVDAYKAGRCP